MIDTVRDIPIRYRHSLPPSFKKIVYPILILVNYNYKMRKKGVLGFAISYPVVEIFMFLTNMQIIPCDVIFSNMD